MTRLLLLIAPLPSQIVYPTCLVPEPLRATRKSVFIPVFTSIVHAFVCSRIDYTLYSLASLKFDYLLSRLLNASARLITRLPRCSHISSFMAQQLHWLPFTTRIQFKVIFLVLKSPLGSAPKYLCNHIRPLISASSLRHLRSSQRHDLFMPHVRTTMAHTRSFASIGPSLWNHLPSPFRSFILSAPLSSSLSLPLRLTFFLELKCTKSDSVWLTP